MSKLSPWKGKGRSARRMRKVVRRKKERRMQRARQSAPPGKCVAPLWLALVFAFAFVRHPCPISHTPQLAYLITVMDLVFGTIEYPR